MQALGRTERTFPGLGHHSRRCCSKVWGTGGTTQLVLEVMAQEALTSTATM